MALPGVDSVHKVSIIPRGIGALGYTIQRPNKDRFLMTREDLENKIAVLLGDRAVEKIIYKHLSTGAADELVKASEAAIVAIVRTSRRIGLAMKSAVRRGSRPSSRMHHTDRVGRRPTHRGRPVCV